MGFIGKIVGTFEIAIFGRVARLRYIGPNLDNDLFVFL
jgi:hypothetical protein